MNKSEQTINHASNFNQINSGQIFVSENKFELYLFTNSLFMVNTDEM